MQPHQPGVLAQSLPERADARIRRTALPRRDPLVRLGVEGPVVDLKVFVPAHAREHPAERRLGGHSARAAAPRPSASALTGSDSDSAAESLRSL